MITLGRLQEGRDISIEEELAVPFGQNPGITRRCLDPLRHRSLLDAIGHQLRGEIVVVGARLICRTMQRNFIPIHPDRKTALIQTNQRRGFRFF